MRLRGTKWSNQPAVWASRCCYTLFNNAVQAVLRNPAITSGRTLSWTAYRVSNLPTHQAEPPCRGLSCPARTRLKTSNGERQYRTGNSCSDSIALEGIIGSLDRKKDLEELVFALGRDLAVVSCATVDSPYFARKRWLLRRYCAL